MYRLRIHDPLLACVAVVTGGLASLYLLDLGSLRFQVISCWLTIALFQSAMSFFSYRVSRLMDPADPARRFWTTLGLAGGAWAAGEWAQLYSVVVAADSTAAQTGTGVARTVALGLGCAALAAVALTYPLPHRSARERICFWLDLATVMVAAGAYGLYWTVSGVKFDRGSLAGELAMVAAGPMITILVGFAIGRLFLSGAAPFSWHIGVVCPAAAAVGGIARALGPGLAHADQAYWIFTLNLISHALLLIAARVQHKRYLSGSGMRSGTRKRPYSRLPYAAIAATYLLLTVALAVDGLALQAWVMLVAAITSTALVVARQLAAFADNARLLSERDALAARLHEMAFSDSLTGLGNRALFLNRLDEAVQRARKDGSEVSVLFVDLDDFKPVNDRFGHAGGDAVLVEVAARLRGCVRSTDVVARLGGDEFAVLLEQAPPDGFSATAARIVRAMEAPCRVAETNVRVRASVGVAAVHGGSGDASALLNRADEAMYAAKCRGKGMFEIATVPAA